MGSGSGILSIAAALCGAGEVTGLDLDLQAVRAGEENAGRNAVADRIRFLRGSLGRHHPDELAADKFDVVVANISARAISEMAGELAQSVKAGGVVVTSGFLEGSLEELRAALGEAGFHGLKVRRRGEWRLIEGRR